MTKFKIYGRLGEIGVDQIDFAVILYTDYGNLETVFRALYPVAHLTSWESLPDDLEGTGV